MISIYKVEGKEATIIPLTILSMGILIFTLFNSNTSIRRFSNELNNAVTSDDSSMLSTRFFFFAQRTINIITNKMAAAINIIFHKNPKTAVTFPPAIVLFPLSSVEMSPADAVS
jgi:hypothetical protein